MDQPIYILVNPETAHDMGSHYIGNDSQKLKEPFQNQIFFLISGKNSIHLADQPKYVFLPSDLQPRETLELKTYINSPPIDFQNCSKLNSYSDHKDLFQYVLNQMIVPPIFLFMGPSRFKLILQTYFASISCITSFSVETNSIFKYRQDFRKSSSITRSWTTSI